MRRRVLVALVYALLVVVRVDGQRPGTSETAQRDSPKATAAGVTFTLPAGWTMTTRAPLVIVDPPETDSHLAIVDVKAKDANGAVTAAWAAYKPDFKRPLK